MRSLLPQTTLEFRDYEANLIISPPPKAGSFLSSLHSSQIQGVPEASGWQSLPQAAPEEEGPRGPPPGRGGSSETPQCHQRGHQGALSQGKAQIPAKNPEKTRKTETFSSSLLLFNPLKCRGSSAFLLWKHLLNSLLGFVKDFVPKKCRKFPHFRNVPLQCSGEAAKEENLLKFGIFIS